MVAPTQATEWTWPADVLAFADEHGLTPYLEPVREMTRRIFPGQQPEAEMTADCEIPDERYITLWVKVTDLTVEQLGTVRDKWYAELRDICSRERESGFFLGMEGSPQ